MKTTLAAIVALALLTAACSDPKAPAAPTPVAPTTTDTFTGTVGVQSSDSHTFAVLQVGGVKVILSDVSPGAAVGLGLGTPSTGSCLVLNSITAVPNPTAQLSGTATVTGNFCVSVFDVGNLVEPVTYTVTVFHS
jgi:hypothetical protein